MAGERRYTRIPPESSGDRVSMSMFLEVGYQSANAQFFEGDLVTFGTSGIEGTVAFVRADTANAGIILLDIDDTSRENNVIPTTGETISIAGQAAALASNSYYDIYQNKFTLASGENPQNVQLVDNDGAAYMRFTEGPAQLDAFGRLRASQPTIVGHYTFTRELSPIDVLPEITGSATISHDANAGAVLLSCTTASGDVAQYTTNLYHPYFPGISQNVLMTVYVGDSGKANVVREWGYFNDNNGVFFRLSGTTLSVVKRSNTSGTPVDQVIAQSAWNVDRANGTGGLTNKSLVNIDVTKINLYWIDFEWLGGGRVRWGMYSDGRRIVLHEENYGNTISSPYMKSGSLPMRWRQENTGASGSTSEFRAVCGAVHAETVIDNIQNYGRTKVFTVPQSSVNSTANVYCYSLRTTPNTHTIILPVRQNHFAIEGSNLAFVRIDYYLNANVTGASWSNVAGADIQYDTAGTFNGNGTLIASLLVNGKQETVAENMSFQYDSYKGMANGTPMVISAVATRLDGITTNTTIYHTHAMKLFTVGE